MSDILSGAGVPNNGDGEDGDLYIRTSNSVLYQKDTGEWDVLLSLRGDDGSRGEPGATIFKGEGAPDSGLGVVGDYYFEVGRAIFWSKDGPTEWGVVVDLRGEVPAGPQGPSGPTGDPGATGPAGATGAAGADGSQIYNGGAPPDPDLGVVGDYFIHTGTLDIYEKQGGGWVVVGTFSSPPSSTWRVGSGAPDNDLGIDGDFYLDSDTGDVYVKDDDTYAIMANIKGTQGVDGVVAIFEQDDDPDTTEEPDPEVGSIWVDTDATAPTVAGGTWNDLGFAGSGASLTDSNGIVHLRGQELVGDIDWNFSGPIGAVPAPFEDEIILPVMIKHVSSSQWHVAYVWIGGAEGFEGTFQLYANVHGSTDDDFDGDGIEATDIVYLHGLSYSGAE